MDLREYFYGLPNVAARIEFAQKAGTKKLYVQQLICKTPRTGRKPSPKLARALHEASGGAIPLSSLRPDIW